MPDRTKIEVIYHPFIDPGLKDKINEIIETISQITLPEESCYHTIFIDQSGDMVICINDSPISSPTCAKRQICFTILIPNVIEYIIENLKNFWQEEINKRKKLLGIAKECLEALQ